MRRHYRNHTNSSGVSLLLATSSSSPSHTLSSSPPHSSLLHNKHQINASEYVWYPPPSSIMSSDDEEQAMCRFQPSLGSHPRRGYEKSHKEKHFDRYRVSDLRTTRDADHHTLTVPSVYSYHLGSALYGLLLSPFHFWYMYFLIACWISTVLISTHQWHSS